MRQRSKEGDPMLRPLYIYKYRKAIEIKEVNFSYFSLVGRNCQSHKAVKK